MWHTGSGEIIASLIIATLLGALLGLERSVSGKHAGMRTYALVALGSALFTWVGTLASYQLSMFAGVNPLQIASSVVLGVGFIGSGLAVLRGEHPVELTTATGIWLAAGVGLACGFGFYSIAVAATLLGILIFSVFSRIEHYIRINWGKDGE